jgi:hypothetical protein
MNREGEFLRMLQKSARLEPVMHGKTKVLYALSLPQGSFELRIGPYTFKRE